MYIPFQQLSDKARIWIYQASRPFKNDEQTKIHAKAQAFLEQWTTHGRPLQCSATLFYDQFLVLAVEESYPIDASICEGFIHIATNAATFLLIILGNVMYKDLDPRLPNTCKTEGDVGVEARDYGPYYYWIMSIATVFPIIFILFMKPQMRRSNADDNKE